MNATRVRDREQDAHARATAAHNGTRKLDDAAAAVRRVEAALVTAFEQVREAEKACLDAGLDVKVGMTPEIGAAYRVWLDRPGARNRTVPDPLSHIPGFLRT